MKGSVSSLLRESAGLPCFLVIPLPPLSFGGGEVFFFFHVFKAFLFVFI